MRKLYAYFRITLTAETEFAWKKYLDNDPKKKYGSRNYTLEEYGLTREILAEEFKEYIDIMSKRINLKDIL